MPWNCNNIKPLAWPSKWRAYLFHMAEVFLISFISAFVLVVLAIAVAIAADIADSCWIIACNTQIHISEMVLCINVWKWKSETVKLSFIYSIQRCVYKTSLRTHGRKPKYLPYSISLASTSVWFKIHSLRDKLECIRKNTKIRYIGWYGGRERSIARGNLCFFISINRISSPDTTI